MSSSKILRGRERALRASSQVRLFNDGLAKNNTQYPLQARTFLMHVARCNGLVTLQTEMERAIISLACIYKTLKIACSIFPETNITSRITEVVARHNSVSVDKRRRQRNYPAVETPAPQIIKSCIARSEYREIGPAVAVVISRRGHVVAVSELRHDDLGVGALQYLEDRRRCSDTSFHGEVGNAVTIVIRDNGPVLR